MDDVLTLDGLDAARQRTQALFSTPDDVIPLAALDQSRQRTQAAIGFQRAQSQAQDESWAIYGAKKAPFLGSVATGFDLAFVHASANKIKDGSATQIDYNTIANFLKRQESEDQRGWMARTGDLVASLPGFAIEFMATGGIGAAAKGAALKGIKAGAGEVVERGAAKLATNVAANAAGITARTAFQPQRIAVNTAERQLPQFNPQALQAGDTGNAIAQEGDALPEALTKAVADTWIEVATEQVGGDLLKAGGSAVARYARLPQAAQAVAARLAQKGIVIPESVQRALQTPPALKRMLDRSGWHGVLPEMGEERMGELARGAVGVEDHFGATGQVFTDPAAAFGQLSSEAAAFAVPGLAGAAHTAATDPARRKAIAGTMANARADADLRAQHMPAQTSPAIVGAILKAHRDFGNGANVEALAANPNPSREDWKKAGLKVEGVFKSAEARSRFADVLGRLLTREKAQQPAPQPVTQGAQQTPPNTAIADDYLSSQPKGTDKVWEEELARQMGKGGKFSTFAKQDNPDSMRRWQAIREYAAKLGYEMGDDEYDPSQGVVSASIKMGSSAGQPAAAPVQPPVEQALPRVHTEPQPVSQPVVIDEQGMRQEVPVEQPQPVQGELADDSPLADHFIWKDGNRKRVTVTATNENDGWSVKRIKLHDDATGQYEVVDFPEEAGRGYGSYEEAHADIIGFLEKKYPPPAGLPAPATQPPAPVAEEPPPVTFEPEVAPALPAPKKKKGWNDLKKKPEVSIKTSSGRDIPAPPQIRLDSNRKATKDLRSQDQWLIDQAKAEAQARGDDFNLTAFSNETVNLPQASRDAMNQYLFGEENPQFDAQTGARIDTGVERFPQPKVVPPILKPLTPKPQQNPWVDSNVEDEQKWYGKRVRVTSHDQEPYEGTVQRVLNRGTVVEVMPDDIDSTFRVKNEQVTLLGEPPQPEAVAPAKATSEAPAPTIRDSRTVQPAATPPEATADEPVESDVRLAGEIAKRLSSNPAPLDRDEFWGMADAAYGGTRAEGKYGPSDAYDALETGINMSLRGRTPPTTLEEAQNEARELQKVVQSVPSQTNRSGEKDRFQQFSTPPHYAFAVAHVANIGPNDIVLEPSAGTGSIAVHAANAGATVYGNDLSKRRTRLLKEIGAREVFNEDAEQIHNVLPGKMPAPTVVVMNPPFSHAAERMGDKKVIGTDLKHIDAALKLLAPGGRLVAIIGAPLKGGETKTFANWYKARRNDYNFRAHVTLSRDVYKGYGTTFPTRVLVIDKSGPTSSAGPDVMPAEPLADVPAMLQALEGVRNGRASVQQSPAGADVQGTPEGSQAGRRPAVSVQPPDSAVGDPVAPGGSTATDSGRPLATERDRGPDVRVERPEPSGRPDSQPAGGTAEARPETGGSEPDARGTGVADGTKPVQQPVRTDAEPATGDAVTLEEAAPRKKSKDVGDSIFESYTPAKVKIKGAQKHPASIVESAAMAAVSPPSPTYSPRLPQALVNSGALSAIQLESVVYAGQAHEQMLDLEVNGQKVRRGFMLGDGTGVGKGRQVAGMILDNFQQGRKKAVWVSIGQKLFQDAKRDWSGLGQDPKNVINLSKVKSGEAGAITMPEGILFSTYGTMASKPKGAGKKSRLEQIVEWLGKDFDGVIAFDESHKMGNAIATKGKRGGSKPSETALVGLELQRQLPRARVVYVSATAATEVANLAYAERLGLWGPGTEFADVKDFVSEIASGGVAAMELVAQDMKASGSYLARNISFNDGTEEGTVQYDRLAHTLTTEQRDMYDKLADAWQVVLQNINKALELTGGDESAKAKSAAMSQFWSSHQRFFNQIITAMQAPSVIRSIEQDLADGKSVVIQLTNTYEAAQERSLGKREEDEELEELDLTPRDSLMQLVEHAFPVQQMEQYVDDNGNEGMRPAVDSKGNAILNQEAVAMRDALLDELSSIRVPDSPIDHIINAFGTKVVAEVTGRGRRVVPKDGKTRDAAGGKVELLSRGASENAAEIQRFMDGQKRILIFSEAGGTGASYHADKTEKNQQFRQHYLLQAGWSAAKAMQGLGRTHRTNQKQAPKYILVHTDLKGQKRFISSIARRLSQLGALTKGQRQASSGGIFTAADNLESAEANDALYTFFRDLYRGEVQGMSIDEFERQTGLKLRNSDGGLSQQLPPITQFLNRLLSLKYDMQNAVFDEFDNRLRAKVDQAMAEGTLDQGVETVRHDSIKKVKEETVFRSKSGSETKYVQLRVSDKTKPITFGDVMKGKNLGGVAPQKFVKSSKGKVYAVVPGPDKTDSRTGRVEGQYRLADPMGYHYASSSRVDYGGNYDTLTDAEAESEWNAAVKSAPKVNERDLHLITGAMLPIWRRVTGKPKVYRLSTDDGETMLGRVVEDDEIEDTLRNLGVGVESGQATSADIAAGVAAVKLANGWRIKPSKVQGENRVELVGPDYRHFGEMDQIGVFRERVAGAMRFFIPIGDKRVVERLLSNRPVVETVKQKSPRPDAMARVGTPTVPVSLGKKSEAPIAAQDVIKTISQSFGVPIRSGRMGMPKRVAGIYKQHPEVIRTRGKFNADLAVVSHELGHHIDKQTGILNTLPTSIEDALAALDYEPEKARTFEGFAEYIRMRLTGEPTPAALDSWFDTWQAQNKPFAAKFSKATDLITRWREQGAEARAESQRKPMGWQAKVLDQPWGETLAEKGQALKRRIHYEFVDRFERVKAYDKLVREKGWQAGVDAMAGDLIAAFNMSTSAHVERALLDGVHTVSSDHRVLGKGLGEFHDLITPAEYTDWANYHTARHVLDVAEKTPGYNPGMSAEDAQYIVDQAEGEQLERFEKASQLLTDLNNARLEMLVDAGVLSPDDAKRMLDKWGQTYTSLRRVKDTGVARRIMSSLLRVPNPVKGRSKEGSGRPIMDPVEATILNLMDAYDAALKQQVLLKLVQQGVPEFGGVEGMGEWIEKVDPNRKATTGQLNEILDSLVEAGFDPDLIREVKVVSMARRGEMPDPKDLDWIAGRLGIDQANTDNILRDIVAAGDENGVPDAETAIALWRPDFSIKPDEKIFRLVIKGKPHLFELSPDLHDALQGMTPMQFGMMLRPLVAMTRLTKLGATGISTTFSAGNVMRDYPTFQAQTKHTKGLDAVLMPAVAAGWNAKSFAGKGGNEVVKLYEEFGGKIATRLGGDYSSIKNVRADVTGHSVGAMEFTSRGVDRLRDFIGLFEAGPRIAEFYGYLKEQGYDLKDGKVVDKDGNPARPPRGVLIGATLAARSVTTDFTRAGRSARALDAFIPFFNAAIQSNLKSGTTVGEIAMGKKNWKQRAIALSLMSTASLMYALLRADDDDYKEQPEWLKRRYWTFGVNGQTYARIPKPHDWGLMANLIEASVAQMKGSERAELKDAVLTDLQYRNPASLPPIVEAGMGWMNYSTFRGGPIESRSMQNVDPSVRANPNTSPAARFIGQFTGAANLSPVKVDHILNETSGGLWGKTIGAGSLPDAASKWSGMSAFTVSRDYSETVEDFYDELGRTKLAAETAKFQGKPDAKLSDEANRMEAYAELMTAIRAPVKDEKDREARFEHEQYAIGLARAVLGKDELDAYPNPLVRDDLPDAVQSIVNAHLGAKLKTATEPVYEKQPKQEQAEFEATKAERDATVSRALSLLKDAALTPERRVALLNAGMKKSGMKLDSDAARGRRKRLNERLANP